MKISGAFKTYNITPVYENLRSPHLSSDGGGHSWENLVLRGVSPSRLFVADGYSGTEWVDLTGNDNVTAQGGDLTLRALGPNPNSFGIVGDGVGYLSGTSGPSTSTNDIIVAVALRFIDDGTQYVCGTYDDGTTQGWLVYHSSTTARFFLGANSTYVEVLTPSVSSNYDMVLVFCINRDDDGYGFVSGSPGTAVDCSGTNANPSNELPLQIFSADGLNPTTEIIYAVGVWQGANLFSAGATGGLEMRDVADELTQRFFGVYSQRALNDDRLFYSISRATNDSLTIRKNDINDVSYIGANIAAFDGYGLCIQGATTNLMQHSHKLNDWNFKANITVAHNATGPDFIVNNTSTISETNDVGADQFHYSSDYLAVMENEWYEIAVVIKNLTTGRNYIRIEMLDGATHVGGYWFDYKNGLIGSAYAATYEAADPHIEYWGNGFYRCSVFVKPTAEAAYIQYLLGDDEIAYYPGDGRAVCEVAAFQVCKGKYYHSILPTDGGTTSRNALVIQIPVDNANHTDFTITFEIRLPNVTSPIYYPTAIDLSDNGLGYDRFTFGATLTTGIPYIYSLVNTVPSIQYLNAVGNIWDNQWHKVLMAFKNGSHSYMEIDDFYVYDYHNRGKNGSFTKVNIGCSFDSGNQLNGHIRNFKIYNKYMEF